VVSGDEPEAVPALNAEITGACGLDGVAAVVDGAVGGIVGAVVEGGRVVVGAAPPVPGGTQPTAVEPTSTVTTSARSANLMAVPSSDAS